MGYVRSGVRDLQLSSILTGLASDKSPSQTLVDIQMLVKHSRSPPSQLRNQNHLRRCIEQWSSVQKSSLLLLEARPGDSIIVKTIMLNLIDVSRSSSRPVLFSLPKAVGRRSGSRPEALESWLQDLVHQALMMDPEFLSSNPERLQASKYLAARSPDEWLSLLSQICAFVPRCFLILDTSALYEQYKDDSTALDHILGLLRKLVESVQSKGRSLKVVVAIYGSAEPTGSPAGNPPWEEHLCRLQCQLVPPRLRTQYAQANQTRRAALQRAVVRKAA